MDQDKTEIKSNEDSVVEWIDIDLGEPGVEKADIPAQPREETPGTVQAVVMQQTAAGEPQPEAAAPENATEPVQTAVYSEEEEKKQIRKKNLKREIISYAVILLVAVVSALLINNFVIFNAAIPSASMEPAISKGDRILGFRLAYEFSSPERGDIVIFSHKCYEATEEETLIKRIVGLPGETILIEDGVLYINGEVYEEDYLSEAMTGSFGPYEVPEGQYFVMGDNRNISNDSRYWDSHFVAFNEIIARAAFSYYPDFTRYNVN